MLGLGGYPLVSLAEARDVAFAHRKQARAGRDPLTEQRLAQHVPTVEEAAAVVLEQQRPGWRHARYAQDWPRSLRAYAFPRIGAMPVSDVTTADVLAILTPIWHDKPETARRPPRRWCRTCRRRGACAGRPDSLLRHDAPRGAPPVPGRRHSCRRLPTPNASIRPWVSAHVISAW